MITVHQFPPGCGLPVSFSPFCAKLEAYLRLTGRAYTTVAADPRKSPNKALPYATLPDGSVLADSGAIIARLEAEGPALGTGDAARELQEAAEVALYHACLHARFTDPEGWREQRKNFEPFIPWLVRPVVMRAIRSSQIKKAAAHGFSGPGDYGKAIDVARRIATALGDRPFLAGDRPAVADCAVWAQVTANAYTPVPNPLRAAVRESSTLTAYIERFATRCAWKLPSN